MHLSTGRRCFSRPLCAGTHCLEHGPRELMRKVLKEGGLGVCLCFGFSPNLSQGCDPIYETLYFI